MLTSQKSDRDFIYRNSQSDSYRNKSVANELQKTFSLSQIISLLSNAV